MKKKIFITKKIPPIAKEILSEHFQVDENKSTRTLSREELIDAISTYDGILSTIPDKIDKIDKSVLEHAKGLSAIANYAIGLDNIDLAYAKERGIAVRALGFGLKVVIYHRSPIKGSHERITQVSWEEFLNTVDYS